jgi:hypothetical protein
MHADPDLPGTERWRWHLPEWQGLVWHLMATLRVHLVSHLPSDGLVSLGVSRRWTRVASSWPLLLLADAGIHPRRHSIGYCACAAGLCVSSQENPSMMDPGRTRRRTGLATRDPPHLAEIRVMRTSRSASRRTVSFRKWPGHLERKGPVRTAIHPQSCDASGSGMESIPNSLRTWANFFGSANRRSAIILRNSASPASLNRRRGRRSLVSSRIRPRSTSPFGDRRELRLAGFRTAAPGLEVESLGYGRQRREEHVEFATDIIPLTWREPGDRCGLHLAHASPTSVSGFRGPRPFGPGSNPLPYPPARRPRFPPKEPCWASRPRTGTQLHSVKGRRKYLTAGERDGFLRETERADRQVPTLCMTFACAGSPRALALTADRVNLAADVLVLRGSRTPHTNLFASIGTGVRNTVAQPSRGTHDGDPSTHANKAALRWICI